MQSISGLFSQINRHFYGSNPSSDRPTQAARRLSKVVNRGNNEGAPTPPRTHIFGQVVNNHSDRFSDRIRRIDDHFQSTLVGNTYVFHNPNEPQHTTVVDSMFVKRLVTGGVVAAVADGAGHPFDEVSARNILLVSRDATKYASLLLERYPTPEAIKADIGDIVTALDSYLCQLTNGQEQTTLAVVRAFPGRDGFRVVGFSVGDSSIGYVNSEGVLTPVTESGRIGGVTYQLGRFPHGDIDAHQMGVIDVVLPEGTVLYLTTDGVSDPLKIAEGHVRCPAANDPLSVCDYVYDRLGSHFFETLDAFEKDNAERAIRMATYCQDINNRDALNALKDIDTKIQQLQASSGLDDVLFTTLRLA